jgi:hypothetical protein
MRRRGLGFFVGVLVLALPLAAGAGAGAATWSQCGRRAGSGGGVRRLLAGASRFAA